jgi:hypothetical protein
MVRLYKPLMPFICLNCPYCGGAFDFDVDKKITTCPSCGRKIMYEDIKWSQKIEPLKVLLRTEIKNQQKSLELANKILEIDSDFPLAWYIKIITNEKIDISTGINTNLDLDLWSIAIKTCHGPENFHKSLCNELKEMNKDLDFLSLGYLTSMKKELSNNNSLKIAWAIEMLKYQKFDDYCLKFTSGFNAVLCYKKQIESIYREVENLPSEEGIKKRIENILDQCNYRLRDRKLIFELPNKVGIVDKTRYEVVLPGGQIKSGKHNDTFECTIKWIDSNVIYGSVIVKVNNINFGPYDIPISPDSPDEIFFKNPTITKEGLHQIKSEKRSKIMAIFLSICAPGAGLIHLRKYMAGLTIFLLSVLLIAFGFLLYIYRSFLPSFFNDGTVLSEMLLFLIIVPWLLQIILTIYVCIKSD